jgi:hypothetical protein
MNRTIRTWTPEAFLETLQTIGWTKYHLARKLGVHETRVRRWHTGQCYLPLKVWVWLCHLADVHANAPLPDKWKPPKDKRVFKPKT